jgi:hypothetical protein
MSKHYPVEQRERAAKMVPITSMSIGRCMPPAGRLAQVRVGAESLRRWTLAGSSRCQPAAGCDECRATADQGS